MQTEKEEVYNFLIELKKLLEQIFQSGFSSINENFLKNIENIKTLSMQYGFIFASQRLERIYNILELNNHSLEKRYDIIMEEYCNLHNYINICIKKVSFDMAKEKMN